jgi:hypothetical protein
MALSDSPSRPLAPPRPPPHPGGPRLPTQWCSPPLVRSARRAPPWSAVAGKLPLLSFGSNHYTTSPAISLTQSPPPLATDGPNGRRWRHHPCPRAPPLFHRLGCRAKLKWAGIAGLTVQLGQPHGQPRPCSLPGTMGRWSSTIHPFSFSGFYFVIINFQDIV